MRIRTLDVFLATLYMMTTTFVSSDGMATDSSRKETVAELLANVQAAVADDRALANMFDIANASQLSEEELTEVLQNILTTSLSGSSPSSSSSSLPSSVEPTEDASAVGDTVSGALTGSLSATMVVLMTVATLSTAL